MNFQTDSQQEFSIIYRFFENQISRYIFLVIDNELLVHQLILNIRNELKGRNKEICHLKLEENEISIYSQIGRFLSENPCNGLLLSGMNLLINRNAQETLSKLNRARDAFEKFRLPIAFIVNNDSLKKIIRIASDFYQMRDLPDFHFTGTGEEDESVSYGEESFTALYPDEDLKIDILEEHLLWLEKEKGLNEDSLNHTVIPLLRIYVNRRNSKRAQEIYERYIRGRENQVKDKVALGEYHSSKK
ncbi:MAG TPA: hypothetical protein VK186_10805 [Candidatus Deferrimicrobium sp.]|nr:hypothetical protein [Candidatus Deferrimicrobium sp.]